MGESTNKFNPEAWSHGAFLASWGVVAFDERWPLSRRRQELFEHAAKLDEHTQRYQEHAQRYQKTGKPIVEREAVALAERIKSLTLRFDARDDYIAFFAGRCLTLKEEQAAGEVCRVSVVWRAGEAFEAFEAPRWWWRTVLLAVPAELRSSGPDSAFGVQSASWLHQQCEAVARERARRDFPPGSLARRIYDGGDFAIPLLNVPVAPVRLGPAVVRPATADELAKFVAPVAPERAGPAVSVVPAPVEDTIREYIKHAASCPDHWDALACVVDVLTKCRQPLGDALGAWSVEALRGRKRPDARKAAKTPANALRNHAIIAAVRALERCGIPPTRNRDRRWLARAHGWEGEIDSDYNPPSGCAIVAEVFGMKVPAVEKVLS